MRQDIVEKTVARYKEALNRIVKSIYSLNDLIAK
jgi:hypothetical protein